MIRKLTSRLLKRAALACAVVAVGAVALPVGAQAACTQWQLPTFNEISQSNGWTVRYGLYSSRWYASTYVYGNYASTVRTAQYMYVTNMPVGQVRFNIIWSSGSEGVYTGTIDANGRITGTTVDRWRPTSRAYWTSSAYAQCVRWG